MRRLIEETRDLAVCLYPSVACDPESLTPEQMCTTCRIRVAMDALLDAETKIHEHADAIRRGHSGCDNCLHGVICPEVEHAETILAMLGGEES